MKKNEVEVLRALYKISFMDFLKTGTDQTDFNVICSFSGDVYAGDSPYRFNSENRRTLFGELCVVGTIDMFKLVLDNFDSFKIDVNKPSGHGYTPLMLLSIHKQKNGNIDKIKLLFQHKNKYKLDVNLNNSEETALDILYNNASDNNLKTLFRKNGAKRYSELSFTELKERGNS